MTLRPRIEPRTLVSLFAAPITYPIKVPRKGESLDLGPDIDRPLAAPMSNLVATNNSKSVIQALSPGFFLVVC